LGMDLKALDSFRCPNRGKIADKPLIVWNHRWEYDKNPIGLFRILYGLVEQGIDFDLALLGEGFEEEPPYFKEAKERLGNQIVQYGRVSLPSGYARLLWEADISLVTSRQDFFGQSVVETIHCGCHPILPNRLAYPNHLEPSQWSQNFYETEDEALGLTTELIQSRAWKKPFQGANLVAHYDWSNQTRIYDSCLDQLAQLRKS
ncbi:MAG TPA: DUF3524 domain-containing protein, partial [Opitutae bacterium]|nr:DUF3524 domain-containing protein [Opitutae bacterium]